MFPSKRVVFSQFVCGIRKRYVRFVTVVFAAISLVEIRRRQRFKRAFKDVYFALYVTIERRPTHVF